ncbi:hypothetical protein SDC9_60073 [bioreactor metagenome]|uniref:HTH marR-type domain-containing protein n=1 Tax=bioreactor metagenome TaxID=1076179 RepID=A0A644XHX7_9ZZZZ
MDDTNEIIFTHYRVSQYISFHMREGGRRRMLTGPQAMALNLLQTRGPLPISALAEQLGSANSTISCIVDRLEKLGLAQRTRSQQDRRVIYVEAVVGREHSPFLYREDTEDCFSALLEILTGEERAQLLSTLKMLDRAFACKKREA